MAAGTGGCVGQVEPDRMLDLHGHSLDRAWEAIDRALERAIASGDRVLLLITGHERRGEPPLERGRIRAAVHDWLAASRHALAHRRGPWRAPPPRRWRKPLHNPSQKLAISILF